MWIGLRAYVYLDVVRDILLVSLQAASTCTAYCQLRAEQAGIEVAHVFE